MTAKSNIKNIFASILPAVVILAFSAIAPRASRIELDDTLPINLPLSDQVGTWRASPILFCQNMNCLGAFEMKGLADPVCPKCESPLDRIPLPEKMILPSDTILFHQRYINDDGSVANVAAVISGQSRSSMHKPEFCLPGQGYSIHKEEKITLPLPDGEDLHVTVLDVIKTGEATGPKQALFIYWFVSPNTQTGSQVRKNWLMLTSRLLKGKIERWAYISMLFPYDENRAHATSQVYELIQNLHTSSKTVR